MALSWRDLETRAKNAKDPVVKAVYEVGAAIVSALEDIQASQPISSKTLDDVHTVLEEIRERG